MRHPWKYNVNRKKQLQITAFKNYPKLKQKEQKKSLVLSYRSSHQKCSVRKGVLGNFTKFTGKHLCQSLFFNKVAGLRPATLLKKRLWHRCFPVNFVKFQEHLFFRTPPGDCFCTFLNEMLILSIFNKLIV